MLIQDVERQTGLDRATIRFYEKEGIIFPKREENGYRSYSGEDVQLLLKVKLLRQLGVSLLKIKSLQQGSGDFAQILSEQIEILEQRIQEDTLAKLVCCEMQQDEVQFATLNSLYYLDMLSAPPASIGRTYCEPVKREVHPWRRYFARMLDYRIIAVILQVLIISIIRVRPFDSNAVQLLTYAAYFLAIPILAVLLHYFGTTPGKWAMGIRLENINGGKLSGGEALYREGKIIWHGLGFFIPVFTYWRMYRSYKEENEGDQQCWNEDTEIIYTEWTTVKKSIFAILYVLSIILSLCVGFDANMPTHRTETLTVSQFAKNHQDYENMWNLQNEYYLNEDGTWNLRNNLDHGYYIIGEPTETERPDFQYELGENGKIQAVFYENSWENADFQSAIPSYCDAAIAAIIGARPRCNYLDILEVDELLETELYAKLLDQQGSGEGEFTIKDVTVSWKTAIENCEYVHDGLMLAKDNESLSYSLQLNIEIE